MENDFYYLIFVCLMKFIKIFTIFIYRSMIILEFTNQPSQIIHFCTQFLNEFMILKCGLLIHQDKQSEKNSFERFLVYIIRPYTYFIRSDLQVTYTFIIFIFIQTLIIYWGYLVQYREKKDTKSFINVIIKYECHSTLNFLLIYFWKASFLLVTEFIGLRILEGFFELLLDEIQDNLFSIICSIIVIFEIIVIILFQELFWNQSLHYIPKQLNKIIKQTSFILYSKILKIMIILIFSSQITNRSYIVLGISIFTALFELYIQLIIKIRLDIILIKLNVLMQSLIICVATQQLNIFVSNTQLQYLWIIVAILFYKSICSSYLSESILSKQFYQTNQNQIKKKLMTGRQNIYFYQKLTQKRDSEYRLTNKILIKNHQEVCNNKSCFCQNEDMVMIKLNRILQKNLIQEYKLIIQQQKSSFIYLDYIQLLVLNDKYFEAFNITHRLINQFHRQSKFTPQALIIKGQVTLQQKLLFKLLQQQILMAIQFSIKNCSQNSTKTQGFKQAIKSYQKKKDSEKFILNQFNKILKQKIEFLEELSNSQSLNAKIINNKSTKIINLIDQFKQQLILNFQRIPTSSNKSLLLFFQIEVMNDLINSQTINAVSTLSENQEETKFVNNIYQQFVNQYSYAKFILGEEGNIELASDNSLNQIKIGKNNYSAFIEMIPLSLVSHHKQFMKELISRGQNKYYLNLNQSYLQISTGIIIPIEFCMDIQFDYKMNQLIAITFLKEAKYPYQFHQIIIDDQYLIKEISQILYYDIFDYPAYLKMQFYNQSIFALIPELKECDFSQPQTLKSYQLNFLSNINKQISINIKSQNRLSEYYKGDLFINPRIINNKILYYIIEISDLKLERKDMIETMSFCKWDMDEKEIINIPLEFNNFYEQTIPEQMWQQPITFNLESSRQLLSGNINVSASQLKNKNDQINQNISQHKVEKSSIAEKNKVSQQNQEKLDDANSQISSVDVRSSAYFKQFQLLDQLIQSKIFPPNIKIFNIIFVIYIFIGIINLSLLIDQVTNLQRYQELMVLLKIKYQIYEPIESFLNTRYTIVGSDEALSNKIIAQQEYDQLIIFPRSNLLKGYDDLKVIQKQEFQSFLKGYLIFLFFY